MNLGKVKEILDAGEIKEGWSIQDILVVDEGIDTSSKDTRAFIEQYMIEKNVDFLLLKENRELNLAHICGGDYSIGILKNGFYKCELDDEVEDCDGNGNYFGEGVYCCDVDNKDGLKSFVKYAHYLLDTDDGDEMGYKAILEGKYNGEFYTCIFCRLNETVGYIVVKEPHKISIVNHKRVYFHEEIEEYYDYKISNEGISYENDLIFNPSVDVENLETTDVIDSIYNIGKSLLTKCECSFRFNPIIDEEKSMPLVRSAKHDKYIVINALENHFITNALISPKSTGGVMRGVRFEIEFNAPYGSQSIILDKAFEKIEDLTLEDAEDLYMAFLELVKQI